MFLVFLQLVIHSPRLLSSHTKIIGARLIPLTDQQWLPNCHHKADADSPICSTTTRRSL